jgi:hypothetical protein
MSVWNKSFIKLGLLSVVISSGLVIAEEQKQQKPLPPPQQLEEKDVKGTIHASAGNLHQLVKGSLFFLQCTYKSGGVVVETQPGVRRTQQFSASGTAKGFLPLEELLTKACNDCLGGSTSCELAGCYAYEYEDKGGKNYSPIENSPWYSVIFRGEVDLSCPVKDANQSRLPENAKVKLVPIVKAEKKENPQQLQAPQKQQQQAEPQQQQQAGPEQVGPKQQQAAPRAEVFERRERSVTRGDNGTSSTYYYEYNSGWGGPHFAPAPIMGPVYPPYFGPRYGFGPIYHPIPGPYLPYGYAVPPYRGHENRP